MGSPQLGPWPWRAAVPAGIRRTGSAGGRGKGGEATRDSPRLDLGAWLGEKRLPAGGPRLPAAAAGALAQARRLPGGLREQDSEQ
jgi:hypothetical protein